MASKTTEDMKDPIVEFDEHNTKKWCLRFVRKDGGSGQEPDDTVDSNVDVVDVYYEKLSYKCVSCKYQTNLYSSFVTHTDMCPKSKGRQEQETYCSKDISFSQEYDIIEDIKNEIVIVETEDKNLNYKCNYCDFESELFFTYQKHISACCKSQDPLSDSTKEIRPECELCHKTFKWKNGLSRHMRTVHGNIRYECQDCNKIFTFKENLVKHARAMHDKIRYQCEVCNKTFSLKENLIKHARSVHDKIKSICELCQKGFSTKQSLGAHILAVHDRVKPYECMICQETFSQKGNLKNHVMAAHVVSKHTCKICQKTFNNETYLNKHMNTTHSERMHKCETCYKTFKTKGNLTKHVAIVHDNLKYECQYCPKTFSRELNLQRHIISNHDKGLDV